MKKKIHFSALHITLFLIMFVMSVCNKKNCCYTDYLNEPPQWTSTKMLVAPTDNATEVNTNPTLDWNNPVDKEGDKPLYDIYIDDDKDFGSPIVKKDLEESFFTPDANLEPGKTYYWQVVAHDKTVQQIDENVIKNAPIVNNNDNSNSNNNNNNSTVINNYYTNISNYYNATPVWSFTTQPACPCRP